MHLSHIANMRNYRKVEEFRQETHTQELAHPRDPRAIDLYEGNRPGLHEVLEHDAVGNVLAERNRDGGDGLLELPMGVNIIRVSWFLYEIR